jgi:RES domain-containing protein
MPSVAVSEKETLDGVPVVTEAFAKTVRLVASARLREAILKPLVDSEEEFQQLAEIESATNARLVAQERGTDGLDPKELIYGVPHAAFINASFSYAKPLELNRFNGPARGAWYAALEIETALDEVIFHLTEFLSRSGLDHAVVEYSEMFASLAGRFLDLRGQAGHPSLNPDKSAGYPAGNALADSVRNKGLNGIIYPSVRHAGGTCVVALWPHAVQSVVQGGVIRLTWAGASVPKIERIVD